MPLSDIEEVPLLYALPRLIVPSCFVLRVPNPHTHFTNTHTHDTSQEPPVPHPPLTTFPGLSDLSSFPDLLHAAVGPDAQA